MSSDHTMAASMTPAAKPSVPRRSRPAPPFFTKKTAAAPRIVPKKGTAIHKIRIQIKLKPIAPAHQIARPGAAQFILWRRGKKGAKSS